MYFANAIYFVITGAGFTSLALAAGMVLAIFDPQKIEQGLGYRDHFLFLGVYFLGAMPLAATVNGGTGGDFFFCLGCLFGPMLLFGGYLTAQRDGERDAKQLIAEMKAADLCPAPPPLPSFTAAPASLADDFDVPPQR